MEQCILKGSLPKRKCVLWISKQIVSAIRKRNTCYCRAKQTASLELLSRIKLCTVTPSFHQSMYSSTKKIGYLAKLQEIERDNHASRVFRALLSTILVLWNNADGLLKNSALGGFLQKRLSDS